MTVTSTTRRASYTGNGVTTTFAVPFQFYEIAVYLGGILQSQGVHYTITQTSPGVTGAVVFLAAPAIGVQVVVVGATAQSQLLDLLDNDSAPAETFEKGMDRLAMVSQETNLRHDQSVRAPRFHAALPELNFAANPDSFLNTDSNGVPRLSTLSGPASPLGPLVTAAQDAANLAYTSAVNAENYKIAAAGHEAAAAYNYALAAGVADQFDTVYLGAHAAEPALDGHGNPLLIGALYFDTTLDALRVYALAGWTGAGSGGGGGGATNLAYVADASFGIVTSDTGTDATLPLADGASAGLMSPGNFSKLSGVQNGATANSSDAALLNRANHTGTQAVGTITGLGSLATQSGTFSGTSSGTNTGDQNTFSTIAVAGQPNVAADAATDTLTLVAGTNVTITTDAASDTITINATAGGSQNTFSTIAVAGQSNVVADATTDTLTLVAGANVTITTDAGTDTITINATGGGGGDMSLASVQTNTALKTFNDATLGLRNVAGTITSFFTNTATAARTYTLQNASGTLAFLADITGTNSGVNTGDQTITLTGNVTGTGTGSFATTISNNVVSNAKLAQMPAHTFKGNNTAATDGALDLTAAQLTAELDTFTAATKGLVSPPSTVTGKFLKDDGTWATVAGGGGSGDMLAANSLSDVASKPAAVTNLNLRGLMVSISNNGAWL